VAFRRTYEKESLFVGLNRGEKTYRWEIPVAEGVAVEQVFTASGNAGQFSIERQAGQAIVKIPGRDGAVLRTGGSSLPSH
jgi:hypothetical protein